ncbi:MAG: phospholipase D-like domain-containing protein [Anaerolineae bacterium]|nr:phospholipase D-like domain-containing protein [Anaerolineae bacterium]
MTRKASKTESTGPSEGRGKRAAGGAAPKNAGGKGGAQGGILGLIVAVIGIIVYLITGVNPLAAPTTSTTLTPAITVTPPPAAVVTTAPGTTGTVQTLSVEKGFGAKKGFWEVYFTAPLNTRDRRQFVGGVDVPLARAIDGVRNTLDIAAFEWDNDVLTKAVLSAVERGVRVRVVADNEHTVDDDSSTILELEAAGVPVIYDNRSAFMHNKFMIMDSASVWMGSTNWTMNGVYRNYNNLLLLRSQRAVQFYQTEFDEMFTDKQFGPRSRPANGGSFTQSGTPVTVLFAPEDDVIATMVAELNAARQSIRFMAFSYTQDPMAQAMLARARAGVTVEGVFEKTGSETAASEMTVLLCAGLDVRQDGYGGVMHHKVIIIDDTTVITGSFNFSDNAVTSNDENLVIIRDPDLARQYVAEFRRVQSISTRATDITCR